MGEFDLDIKSNVVKFTAATAIAITGISAVGAINTNSTTSHVEAATRRVKVNYIPGYGVNIWSNYNHPHFTGKRARHGATYNVISKATDKKGNLWYQIGQGQWIQAQYTVSANKAVKKDKKAKKHSSKQASATAASVVSLAESELGKPYVWGATGPSSFDCSGLTSYVYNKAADKNISRTTYSQVKQGKTVSMDDLQPGDLLFWGSASAPYHVGIYVGNNQYVHAATPSQGVIKRKLSSYFYPSVAKRIL